MDRYFTKQRLSEMVANEIRSMIDRMGFKPGDKIFSENELTKRLNVSRSSVREAIRILEVTGLLTVQQGKGVFIRDSHEEQFQAVGQWIQEHSDNLFEQFEVRLLIEPAAAARAARSANAEELEQMRAALGAFEEAVNTESVASAIAQDQTFHTTIARATRNRTLHVLMKTFARSLNEGWITSLHLPGRLTKTISEHRAILNAIQAGDEEAARQAMMDHLERALADIKEHSNRSTDNSGSSE